MTAADVLAFVRRETFSPSEHRDPYTRGWIAAMAHVERWLLASDRGAHDARTLAGLRELRSALVVETHVLFSAEHVEGEWET